MARPAAYPSLPQPGEAGALERDHAGVASPHVHTHPGVIAHSVGDDELTAALLLGHELGTCTCRDQTDEMDETREDMHVVGSRLNRRAVAEAGPLCETSFYSAALIPVTLPGHVLCADTSPLASRFGRAPASNSNLATSRCSARRAPRRAFTSARASYRQALRDCLCPIPAVRPPAAALLLCCSAALLLDRLASAGRIEIAVPCSRSPWHARGLLSAGGLRRRPLVSRLCYLIRSGDVTIEVSPSWVAMSSMLYEPLRSASDSFSLFGPFLPRPANETTVCSSRTT